MADEKRQIVLDLLARAKTKQGTDEAAKDLDKFGDAAERADKKTEKLGKTSSKAAKETDKLGNDLEGTKGKISGLDKEIESITKELGDLAGKFAEAGSASERADLSKAIRRTEGDLRKVTKSKSILSDLLPDPEEETQGWAKRLTSSIGNGIKEAASSSALATGGAVLGAALAPEIGGLISAAVVGGVGIGGIIGGIALAAKSSPEIQAQASSLGKEFTTGLQKEAKDAFSGPIMESLGKLEGLSGKAVAGIGKAFRSLAPYVGPLVDKLIDAGEAIGGSLVNAASKAGPVLGALGNFVDATAHSLSGFMDMAASHSKEGASALNDFSDSVQHAIQTVTMLADFLADIKGGLDSFDDGIDKARYSLEDQVSWLDLTADGYKKGSEAAELYRKGIIGASDSVNNYDHYIQGAAGSTQKMRLLHLDAAEAAEVHKKAEEDLTNQLKAQTDPAFAVLNAIDGVKKAHDDAAEATKKFGSKSEEAGAATRKLAEAAIALQAATGAAGGTLDGHMTPALKATLQAAGLTQSEIEAVARQLRNAKKAAEDYEGTYKARVVTDYVSRYSTIVESSAQKAYEQTKKDLAGKRAAGGPVVRGAPYLVGENGPEIMVPDASGRVLSGAASRGLMVQGMAAGNSASQGGSGPARATIEVIGGADQGVATLVNYLIRTGKINVTVSA